MITAGDLPLRALEREYALGSWTSIELLPGGKSQHFRFRAGGHPYVLRRSYRSKTEESLQFEHDLIAHLRGNGYPGPTVVPRVNGMTYIRADDRLYCITEFVQGEPYHAGNERHLEEVARALAAYHSIVESFPQSRVGLQNGALTESLRSRLMALDGLGRGPQHSDEVRRLPFRGGDGNETRLLLASLPIAIRIGYEELAKLDKGWGDLPRLVIHAGCRRGSAFFNRDRLIAMLDFDSAHHDVRVLDLAVAVHDFGKIYGDPRSRKFKVELDLAIVRKFLNFYLKDGELTTLEMELLPTLLIVKRIKRALGRYHRFVKGEQLSDGDKKKIALELARVEWLMVNEEGFRGALRGEL